MHLSNEKALDEFGSLKHCLPPSFAVDNSEAAVFVWRQWAQPGKADECWTVFAPHGSYLEHALAGGGSAGHEKARFEKPGVRETVETTNLSAPHKI